MRLKQYTSSFLAVLLIFINRILSKIVYRLAENAAKYTAKIA